MNLWHSAHRIQQCASNDATIDICPLCSCTRCTPCDISSFNASLTCTFPPIQTIHLVAAVAQCVNPAFTNKPLLPSQLFTCGGVIVLLFVATHIRKPCNKWNSTIVASACRAGPLFFSDWINYIVHISFNHQLAQKQSCQFKGFKFDKMGQTFYY